MAKIIGLPKLSPTMEEGTIVSWSKKEGEEVEIDELLAEVETDKATMEFRSFDKGVLLKILVPEGETLAAEVPVAIIGKAGEDISELLKKVEAGATVATDGGAQAEPSAGEVATPEAAAPEAPAQPTATAPTAESPSESGRILSSPLVRRLAREQGIDLRQVRGTGPHGRIVKSDLESFSAPAAPAGAPAPDVPRTAAGRPGPIIEKASSMRRTIARRLTQSKLEAPHHYLTIDLDVEPLAAARRTMNAALEAEGKKVSFNDLIIKAAAVALRRKPKVNASWMDTEIHYHQVVDISVAVAIEDGLVTPVVRDADRKGVAEISEEMKDLAARARDRKLKPEEMTGGTFSISNLGMYGIEEFAAVVNPPEGAILAVGTIRQEPVIKDAEIVAGQRLRLTMSCDHRVVDGALGAEYLAVLKSIIESPLNMLL